MIPLPVIEGYASQFAGTPITISCPAQATFTSIAPASDGTVLGFVPLTTDGQMLHVIVLPRARCNRLEHLDHGNVIDPSDMAVLAHEATHIALNDFNECRVEVSAMANEWSLLKLFKVAAWRARIVLAGAKAFDAGLLPAYHGCSA